MRTFYHINPKLLCMALLAALFLFNSCKKDKDSLGYKRDELNDARKKWESQGLNNYKINLVISCGECFAGGPYKITVTNKVITSATNAKGEVYSGGSYKTPFAPFSTMRTIDEVFEFIKTSLDRKPDRSDIRYDPEYGYPTRAYFDYDANVVDEEYGLSIIEFNK